MDIAPQPPEPGYRQPDVPTTPVTLVIPHRFARLLLPLMLAGLVLLCLAATRLPATFVVIAQFVVLLAYRAFFVYVVHSPKRRPANVHVDATGLCEGPAVVVPRTSIESVFVSTTRGSITTIDIRGARPVVIEVAPDDAARQLIAALDPHRGTAPLEFLATTTPTYMAVVAWMGLPMLFSMPLQFLPMNGADQYPLIGYAVPCVVAWLFASWWFMRRRRVTIAATHLTLPRLLSTHDESIPLSQVVSVRTLDALTIELAFTNRRPRKLKIYDPAVVNEFLTRLNEDRLRRG